MSIGTPRRSSSGKTVAALPTTPMEPGPLLLLGLQRLLHRIVKVLGDLVEVAVLHPPVQARRVDVDDEAHPAVQRDRQRLRPAHAAAPAGQGEGPREGAAEPLLGDRGEGLVGALHDPLGADVDPRAGGHLAVHREPEVLEPAELGPGRPVAHEVGVGDEHPRGPLVRLHDPHGTARLHQHRLVRLERGQRADHRVERLPVPGRATGAAVDDEVVGPLGDLGVEVVHQHAQRCLSTPVLGGQFRAARCADGAGAFHVVLLQTVWVCRGLMRMPWGRCGHAVGFSSGAPGLRRAGR